MYYGTDDGGFSTELTLFMISLLVLTAIIYRRKDIRRWLGNLERKFLGRVQNWWWSRDERREKREFEKASRSEAAVAARKRMEEPVRRPVKINALGFLDDEEMAEFAEELADEFAADAAKEATVEAAEGTETADQAETPKAAAQTAVSHGPNEWRCSACGTWNSSYLCQCGMTKRGIRAAGAGPAALEKWRCKCGRMNEGGTTECECGLLKPYAGGSFSFLKKKRDPEKTPDVPEIPVKDNSARWAEIQAARQKELASQMGANSAPVKEPDTNTEEDADAILEDELSAVRINLEESMKGLR